ncbi:alpha/beta fold hydrolase [Albimonas pacifica]|uniref:Non-heme chloroperoxidase n=1 Tax=Albimonas pacifica TaxID=1114924 RepID=A0A1I3IZN5_9RHOB|nr:alpha/beta hydrolase [Albimonas pacifica]SFI53472.1 non-heme chloroperoxidase [Albimonas pacifica]
MAIVTASDGARLFYKDWGPKAAQPVMFHHGWPLSADDWDAQMLFFLSHGYRVIAHDRRGHGRSDQTDRGADMDTYAADVAEIVQALDLRDAIHIGHSTGGGEVARYAARAERGRVAAAALIAAIPPGLARSEANPQGVPPEVFDGLRAALSADRAQAFLDLARGPVYGFNRRGARVSRALIDNWWRQGMAGAAKAQHDGIAAFSETDFTGDLEAIAAPILFLHGEDDQLVPVEISAGKAIGLVRDGTMMTYAGLSHGLLATHPELANADLLAFARSA